MKQHEDKMRLHEHIQSPFLSVKQSAAFLLISVATLYRLRETNGFPAPRKHAGRIVFSREELERWSNDQVVLPCKPSLFQEARARSLKSRHAVETPNHQKEKINGN